MCLTHGVRPHLTSSSATQVHLVDSGIISSRVKFAVALNLPAVLAALFLNTMVFRFQTNYLILLAAPFVLILWYPVGRWLDRRLGWVQCRKRKRTLIGDTLLVFCGLLAIFSAVILLQTINQAYTPDSLWFVLGVCSWFAFLLVVLAGVFYARFFRASDVAATQATP
jgi:hypothetical protein